MNHIYLKLVTIVLALAAECAGALPPRVSANNSPPGVLNDTSNVRNMYRQRVLNDIVHRRGSPNAVTAQVYDLSFFSPFWLWYNKWETTFGWFNRGLYAKMPFGQKQYYSGLHPRYVEYRFHDKDGDFLYAQCFLHFYSSRSIPGRTFVRSYQCTEQDFARTTQGYKGFRFAAVVEVVKSKVVKYKDLTADWMKDGSFDTETKFVNYLTDPTLFDDPNRPRNQDDDDPLTN